MGFLHSLPDEVVFLVTRCLVPLFLLFNIIVGWIGLAQREANRSDAKLSEQELSALGRALWGAWLVGVLAGLVVLWAVFEFFRPFLQDPTRAFGRTFTAGVVGAILGIVRGSLPRMKLFRRRTPPVQRRILAVMVMGAVGTSVASAVLYYNSGALVQDLIASAYTCMLILYAAVPVVDFWK